MREATGSVSEKSNGMNEREGASGREKEVRGIVHITISLSLLLLLWRTCTDLRHAPTNQLALCDERGLVHA